MSRGFGIAGHCNIYSTGVRVDNWVEDRVNKALAAKPAPKPRQETRSEAQDHYLHPASQPVPPVPQSNSLTIPTGPGLSFSTMMFHGPEGALQSVSASSWKTTTQIEAEKAGRVSARANALAVEKAKAVAHAVEDSPYVSAARADFGAKSAAKAAPDVRFPSTGTFSKTFNLTPLALRRS